jgi:hypothetical protein
MSFSAMLIISITSRLTESSFDRLRLTSLTSNEREKLENLVMTRLSQISIKERDKIVKFERTSLLTRNCIKHLHSHLQFFIEEIDSRFSLSIEASSFKSHKSTTNSDLLKKFCDIFKDNTKNKRWKEANKIYKIKANNSCFLMLLNKKSREESKISEYHLIDSFDSRIATTKV